MLPVGEAPTLPLPRPLPPWKHKDGAGVWGIHLAPRHPPTCRETLGELTSPWAAVAPVAKMKGKAIWFSRSS